MNNLIRIRKVIVDRWCMCLIEEELVAHCREGALGWGAVLVLYIYGGTCCGFS